MFKSLGRINYDDREGFRLTVEINQDLSDYYRSLIPKYHKVTRPRYSAHITVVRPEIEKPPKIRYWGDYQNEEIEFLYDPYVLHGRGYYWLDVWCKRLETIREELGLPTISRYTVPPEGFKKCFHCTIGNYVEKEFDMANVLEGRLSMPLTLEQLKSMMPLSKEGKRRLDKYRKDENSKKSS